MSVLITFMCVYTCMPDDQGSQNKALALLGRQLQAVVSCHAGNCIRIL